MENNVLRVPTLKSVCSIMFVKNSFASVLDKIAPVFLRFILEATRATVNSDFVKLLFNAYKEVIDDTVLYIRRLCLPEYLKENLIQLFKSLEEHIRNFSLGLAKNYLLNPNPSNLKFYLDHMVITYTGKLDEISTLVYLKCSNPRLLNNDFLFDYDISRESFMKIRIFLNIDNNDCIDCIILGQDLFDLNKCRNHVSRTQSYKSTLHSVTARGSAEEMEHFLSKNDNPDKQEALRNVAENNPDAIPMHKYNIQFFVKHPDVKLWPKSVFDMAEEYREQTNTALKRKYDYPTFVQE